MKKIEKNIKRCLPFDPAILICAFRYALGRETYAVSEVADYITDNWRLIPNKERALIQKEIEKALLSGNIGSNCDREKWLKVGKIRII